MSIKKKIKTTKKKTKCKTTEKIKKVVKRAKAKKPDKVLKERAKYTRRVANKPPFNHSLTPEAIIKVIYAKFGIVSDIADACSVSRKQVHEWVKKHEWVKEACLDAREAMLDLGENRLISKVRNNDTASTLFLLKCRGKDRGYIESLQLGGRLGHDISVDIIGTGSTAPAMDNIN